MSGLCWKSLAWIGDGINSYLSTMRELVDNTFTFQDINYLRNADVMHWFSWLAFQITRVKNSLKDCAYDSSSNPLLLCATAIFGLFGLVIAFFVVFVVLKFLLWVCFGRPNYDVVLQEVNTPMRSRAKVENLEDHVWFRLSLNDLESARNDFEGNCPAPEWICYKCQQSMKKLLKAFLISQNPEAAPDATLDLIDLASFTQDQRLLKIARRVQRILGPTFHMYYPDRATSTKVPRDNFSLQVAVAVHELTEEAVEYAGRLLGIRV